MKLLRNSGIFIFLLTLSETFVSGVEYGPSLSSLTGVFVNWKGPDLLSIESGRKVMLENYPGLSATLPLISGESKATSDQIFKERGISTVGEFVVEAPRGFGLIVVIQELKLRTTTRERGNPNVTVSCSDYIQIGDTIPEVNGVNANTNKICGVVLRDDTSVAPKGLLGPRTFRSTSGRVRVALNHAYVAELVDSILGSKTKHTLRAEITFTAYHGDCAIFETPISNSTESSSGDEIETFELCSDYTKTNFTCISSKLLCDDTYHCGGDGETLGSDESISTCPDKPVRTTEIYTQDETANPDENKQDGLGDLVSYLGIPSLSSYQSNNNKKYERRFRPSYVSSQQSSGTGFLYDYTTKRTTENPAVKVSSTTEINGSSGGGSIEINVVGPSNTKNIKNSNILGDNGGVNEVSSDDVETDIYSRRELSHAINSVIYGVLVFIVFTILITVFIVCLTKKIQMTWTARTERRNSEFDPEANRRRVSTPAIISNMTTALSAVVGSRRASECDPGGTPTANVSGAGGGSRANATPIAPINVGILELPPELETTYDMPPSYDTLFPTERT